MATLTSRARRVREAATLTPRALSFDRSGVVHAFTFTGAARSFCGWKRFNYNKLVDLVPCKFEESGYEYIPPTDVFVTCFFCLVSHGKGAA